VRAQTESYARRSTPPCCIRRRRRAALLLTKSTMPSAAPSTVDRHAPCHLRARTSGKLPVAGGHPRAPRTASNLGTCRLTPCLKRPVTKLLASPVTVWNRRRCLRLAQRGQRPSDKPVGDHGGLLACSRRVSPIRGSHVSGMKSSKQLVTAGLVRWKPNLTFVGRASTKTANMRFRGRLYPASRNSPEK
jgi:hypothetical protein